MKKNVKAADRVGQIFGRLTIESVVVSKGNKPFVNCECDCGNKHYARLDSVVCGSIKSCGCLVSESKHLTKHGMSKHPAYIAWRNMKRRCYDANSKDFRNYGLRGITVCDSWKSNPEVFIEWAENNGWEKGLQLDRIDNDGHYSPENCRFVTHRENCAPGRRRGPRKKSTLPIGVYFSKKEKKYRAQIYVNGTQIHLGYFLTSEEASNAYKAALEALRLTPVEE